MRAHFGLSRSPNTDATVSDCVVPSAQTGSLFALRVLCSSGLPCNRDDWETKLARLEHAAHIPVVEIEHRLDELDPGDEIIVYCHHGIRSAAVADFLRRAGYPKAVNLTGGLDLWAETVDPSMRRY